MEAKTLLGLHDLAAHLGVPFGWLKAEALAGRVPCLRAGRRLLFERAAVERALATRAAQDGGRPPANDGSGASSQLGEVTRGK